MIRSSIDLGTNTCLLLVGEWDPKRREVSRVLGDFSTIVRLGEGVDQKRELQPQAMQRTLDCLKDYSAKVRTLGTKPEETICVATSSSRDAKNSAEFYDRITRETGFRFQVISGDEEARLTFLGALLPGMSADKATVIDIGGGSTELISLQGGQSVDVGSVRFTERYLKSDPVTDDEFWKCQDEIDVLLEPLKPWRKSLPKDVQLVGVAGTVTTLAAWYLELPKFDAAKLDQVVLTRGDVHRMVEELKWRTIQERQGLTGIEAKRADVLLAGALVLWRTMELLQFPDCRVSTRGLRYGAFQLATQ